MSPAAEKALVKRVEKLERQVLALQRQAKAQADSLGALRVTGYLR